MEDKSFFLKLSKSTRWFLIIVIVLISSNLVNNYVSSEFLPDFLVTAEQWDYLPSEYVPFSVLDSFDIERVFNSSDGFLVSTNAFFEIGKITANYGTSIVKYNEDYYRLRFDVPDEGVPYNIPLQYVILSFAISLISLIMIILIMIILLINILKIVGRAFPFG